MSERALFSNHIKLNHGRITKLRVSKKVRDTLNKVFIKLESEYGIDREDIVSKYQSCALDDIPKSNTPRCKYFLRDGSPCPNCANPKSGFCTGHRSCGKKYIAIESLFRRRFKDEEDKVADSIDLQTLSITAS